MSVAGREEREAIRQHHKLPDGPDELIAQVLLLPVGRLCGGRT